MTLFQDQFKSILIQVYSTTSINQDDYMKRVMLSQLLVASNDQFQTRLSMNQYLDELYGTSFSGAFSLIGDQALLVFTVRMIAPSMIGDDTLLLKVINLIEASLFNQTAFIEAVFKEEKHAMISQLKTIKDKKNRYAASRFNELLMPNSILGLSIEARLEMIEALTLESLYNYYQNQFLKEGKLVFATGPFVENERDTLKRLAQYEKGNFESQLIQVPPRSLIQKTEILPMQQALLFIGFHTTITRHSMLHTSMQLFERILGSGPDSRLFKIVREEMGLCYMIGAHYDDQNGKLVIQTGVDLGKQNEAYEAIMGIVDTMKQDAVTHEELELAKKSLQHDIYASLDLQSTLIQRELRNLLFQESYDLEARMKQIEDVNLEMIIGAAKQLTLEVYYTLKGDKNETN
jgi:predicted Zn-dependent peptidase